MVKSYRSSVAKAGGQTKLRHGVGIAVVFAEESISDGPKSLDQAIDPTSSSDVGDDHLQDSVGLSESVKFVNQVVQPID